MIWSLDNQYLGKLYYTEPPCNEENDTLQVRYRQISLLIHRARKELHTDLSLYTVKVSP
jgi:hypothetical protein